MTKNQKILALFAALVALGLLLAIIVRPKDRDSVARWTPPADLTASPTPGSVLLEIPTATRTPAATRTEPIETPRATPTLRAGETVAPAPTDSPAPMPSFTPTSTNLPEEVRELVLPEGTDPSQVFFVAPDGSSEGDGTIENPWPLQFMFDHPEQIQPGAIIWVRGGEYRGSFANHLDGEEGRPITVRAYPGERAILMGDDRVLDIGNSSYVNLWGLEITATENSRDPVNRPETAYGVRIHQGKDSHHIKFINMIVHDMPAQGFGWWKANKDSEIYGSLIYYNGVNQFDHGVYMNNETGTKRVVDNIIFDNASHGIHAYGNDEQWLNNVYIEGNTVFNNGSIGFSTTSGTYGIYKRNILVGGYNVAENPVIINNYTYYPDVTGEALNLGYRAGSSNATVEDNYFAGGKIELGGQNTGVKLVSNTFMGFGAQALGILPTTQNEWLVFRPSNTRIFVRPNQYEPNRGHITIYNWLHQDQVTIRAEELQSISIKEGDNYELHNVQDYFNDVITGTYDGEKIEVPMKEHSVAQPLGLSFKPASTFPEFGAFVLIVKSN